MAHRKTDKEQVIIAKGVGWLFFFFFLIDFFSNSNLILLPFISVKREKDRVREDGIS